jgi:hypothetical protein
VLEGGYGCEGGEAQREKEEIMADDTHMRAECRNCGASVDLGSVGPCPTCNRSAGKDVYVTVTTKVVVASSMMARGVEEGKGLSNYFVRIQQRQELFRKTGRMHELERTVDRRNGHYYEHIVDMETGEVVRHKDEPLREHDPEQVLRRRERGEGG